MYFKSGNFTNISNSDYYQKSQLDLRIYGCNIRVDNYELLRDDSVIKCCLIKCYQTYVSGMRIKDKNESSSVEEQPIEQNVSAPDIPNVICAKMIDAFEDLLKSMTFDFVRIHSIVCQKDDIKVELALCENGSSNNIFARVYVNTERESDFKWANCVKTMWRNEFQNVRTKS